MAKPIKIVHLTAAINITLIFLIGKAICAGKPDKKI